MCYFVLTNALSSCRTINATCRDDTHPQTSIHTVCIQSVLELRIGAHFTSPGLGLNHTDGMNVSFFQRQFAKKTCLKNRKPCKQHDKNIKPWWGGVWRNVEWLRRFPANVGRHRAFPSTRPRPREGNVLIAAHAPAAPYHYWISSVPGG